MIAFVALIVLGCSLLCQGRNVSTYEFLSRPDIIPPIFDIVSIDHSIVSDGYTFVTPKSPEGTNFTKTMYIYNNGGSLVWSGHKFNIDGYQMTVFDRCYLLGAPHICVTMYHGPRGGGLANGSFSRIIDNTYHQVQTVAPSFEYNGNVLTMDMHEFNPVGNGSSALLSSYDIVDKPVTFPKCAGSPSARYIKTGLFTEILTDGSNTTLFEWNALDHVEVEESLLCPGDYKAGSGAAASDAMDFFHINSIDKDHHGDYLVSARHTSTIYKIAGYHSPSGQAAGSIIWRLGGKRNDFSLTSHVSASGTFNFSFQHHARFYDGGIRFWDNANSEAAESNSTSIFPSATSSSGMDVKIDERANIATLVYQALPPSSALDHSQGSHQILPNGNHFCGLGSTNEVFERAPNGALAMDAYIGQAPIGSYRAAKHQWTGLPSVSELALFTYAHNFSASSAFYVSWNGATTVYKYRFFLSNSSTGGFDEVATAIKDHTFETIASSSQFGFYSYVEALDAQDAVLGRTTLVRTFVPDADLANSCDHLQCPPYTDYTTATQAGWPIEVKYVNI